MNWIKHGIERYHWRRGRTKLFHVMDYLITCDINSSISSTYDDSYDETAHFVLTILNKHFQRGVG